MKLVFLPEALAEFREAVAYYGEKERGLGKRLRDEVRRACSVIAKRPLGYRERPGGYRRLNCPVFPYFIAYFIRRETVVIAAIGHGSRHPDYWKRRVE
jgi:plasmid stabilization system protein ParE